MATNLPSASVLTISSGTRQYLSDEGGGPEVLLKTKTTPFAIGTPSLIITLPEIDPVLASSANAVTPVQQTSTNSRIEQIFFMAYPFPRLSAIPGDLNKRYIYLITKL